jgi:hypothetical protein
MAEETRANGSEILSKVVEKNEDVYDFEKMLENTFEK